MINRPDYDRAAAAAMQLLVDYHHREMQINKDYHAETPVNPMPILISYPGVRVLPYTSMALDAGMDRKDLIYLFGNQDAATFHLDLPGMDCVKYVVVYNMRLPLEIIWRALARELGHIVLGHDGVTRSMEARMHEAVCFAHHFTSPRPVLNFLRQSGLPFTLNVLTNTTGCAEECVQEMQTIPGAHVPAELNAHVRDLFVPHLREYVDFYRASNKHDKSPLLDLGTFMDNYEE